MTIVKKPASKLVKLPLEQRCLVPCPDCPFGGPKVGGKGNPNSPLMIIGESPGRQENDWGQPFIGPSGALLDVALRQLKDYPEPYVINAMQCVPPGDLKDEDTLIAGVAACRNRVLAEIERAPRDVILALGTPALWSVSGDYGLKITQQRGKVLPSQFARVGVVPSVHPAFLMRGGAGATLQQHLRDVEYALSLVKGGTTKKPPVVQYEVCRDERDIQDIADYFRSLGDGHPIAGDVETSGFSARSNRILTAGFAPFADEVYCVPEHLVPAMRPLLQNKSRLIWHNGKFDVQFFWAIDMPEARVDEDTMLMSYAMDENGGIHDLEQVSSDWLNSPNWKGVLDQHLPNRKTSYEVIPRDILTHYMALDIGNTRGLYDVMRPRIAADPALERLYTRTLIPGSNFIARMEGVGLKVDLKRVEDNVKYYEAEIQKGKEAFFEFAKPFPNSGYTDKLMNSHIQMKRLLYDDMKIPMFKGRRTTDKKVLEKLPKLPVIQALFASRKVVKEYGTYVKNIPKYMDVDGRVHASYWLHGTKTGRLASSDPNLQNVPRNPRIRGQYIADKGRRFLEPDLNQAELRVLACLSGDKTLCHIYESAGMSLHNEVRADIWGYPKDWSPAYVREQLQKFGLTEETRYGEKGDDRIVEEQKMRAKAVNFGIVYGRTAPSIAEEFSIKPQEAQGWIDKWFKKFPQAKEFMDRCRQAPVKGLVLVSPFGNKRRFGVVGNERLEGMMNEASNFLPQCSASHSNLHAAIELCECLAEKYDSYSANLVHDSNLMDCPDDDVVVREVAQLLIRKMEDIPRKWGFTRIPFVAEAKMGYRWGSLSGFDPFKAVYNYL